VAAEPVLEGIGEYPSMLDAVDEAVAAMSWLKPSDYAMVALAQKYAQQVDAAEAAKDSRGVGYLGQQLHGVLRALGGSPVERKLLEVEGSRGGRLGELREARASRVSGAASVHSAATGT